MSRASVFFMGVALILAIPAVGSTQSANDDCANAIVVTDGAPSATFDITAGDTNDGAGSCMTWYNIWYEYTATCTGVAVVDTCGGSFDSMLAAYDGLTCSPLGTELACVDDACGSQALVSFPVTVGDEILIEVGSFGWYAGSGGLNISCAASPANDTCTGAAADPASYGITGDGSWPDDTAPAANDYQLSSAYASAYCGWSTDTQSPDVVYFFDVSNGSGDVTLSMSNPSFDASLWVVTDCADLDGTVLDCADNIDGPGTETLTLTGLEDGRYYVICDGYTASTAGTFTLTSTGVDVPVELVRMIVD